MWRWTVIFFSSNTTCPLKSVLFLVEFLWGVTVKRDPTACSPSQAFASHTGQGAPHLPHNQMGVHRFFSFYGRHGRRWRYNGSRDVPPQLHPCKSLSVRKIKALHGAEILVVTNRPAQEDQGTHHFFFHSCGGANQLTSRVGPTERKVRCFGRFLLSRATRRRRCRWSFILDRSIGRKGFAPAAKVKLYYISQSSVLLFTHAQQVTETECQLVRGPTLK